MWALCGLFHRSINSNHDGSILKFKSPSQTQAPNSTTLGIKIATHEHWRKTDTDTTALPNDLGCL